MQVILEIIGMDIVVFVDTRVPVPVKSCPQHHQQVSSKVT